MIGEGIKNGNFLNPSHITYEEDEGVIRRNGRLSYSSHTQLRRSLSWYWMCFLFKFPLKKIHAALCHMFVPGVKNTSHRTFQRRPFSEICLQYVLLPTRVPSVNSLVRVSVCFSLPTSAWQLSCAKQMAQPSPTSVGHCIAEEPSWGGSSQPRDNSCTGFGGTSLIGIKHV